MFEIRKKIEISAAHSLRLDYVSKCKNPHGHNWEILICCKAEKLDQNGMVFDFTKIKDIVSELDHRDLNHILEKNPTAENIACWIAAKIGEKCYRIEIQESAGNVAIWSRE